MGDPKAYQAPFNMKSSKSRSAVSDSDPMDCSPPDSSAHGILQARILEWVAFPFSRGFPNPGIKAGLIRLRYRRILYQLGYQASPLLHSCFKVCSSSISGLHIDSVKGWGILVHKSPVEIGVQSLERASRVTQWESL